MHQEKYDEKINLIKSYLRAGDVYQINFTQPIKYKIGCSSPLDLFANLSKCTLPGLDNQKLLLQSVVSRLRL